MHHILPLQEWLPRFLPSSNLNLLSFNARSTMKHIANIRHLAEASHADILMICETWTKPHHTAKMVELSNFRTHRLDRTGRGGGGVAIYMSKASHSNTVFQFMDNSWEVLAIKVWDNDFITGPIVFVVVYRSVSSFSDNDLSILARILDSISSQYPNVVISGDLNIDLDPANASHLSDLLLDLLNELGLELINRAPTRHGATSATTLDLIITSSNFKPLRSGQCPGLSDHELVFASFNAPSSPLPGWRTFRNFRAIQPEALVADIEGTDWSPVTNTPDPDEATDQFADIVNSIFQRNVPLKSIRIQSEKARIFKHPDVILSCQLRDIAYTQWKRCKTAHNYAEFCKFRRNANYVIRAKNRELAQRCFEGPISWKRVNEMGLGSKSKMSAGIDPNEFAEYLSPHSARDQLHVDSSPIPSSQSAHLSYNVPSASLIESNSFSLRNCSEFEVLEAVMGIKSNAQGHRDVPIKFLKLILPHILHIVTSLFNKLITCSHFPARWKTGLITPIPKTAAPNSPSDWRPITVLPAISKAFEFLIAKQITEYVEVNGMLSPHQSGFRCKHSTCTALANVVGDIRLLCDNGDVVLHVLLDLSKAFESVPHRLLVNKLHSLFRFSTSACSLIASYLNNRTFMVASDGRISPPQQVLAGVPQGAVLAPLLFSLFFNDVSAVLQNFHFHIYADDLQIYAVSSKDHLPSLVNSVNSALSNISTWCSSNGLSLNPSKSQAILYAANARTLELANASPPVLLQGQIIPISTNHIKNLGLLMDPGLTWQPHVNLICSRIYFGLRSLYAVSQHLPQHVRAKLVNALLLPHFFYADVVLYPLQGAALTKLLRALKACVRYVYRLGRHAHISALLNQFLPGTLPSIFELRVLTFIYRAGHRGLPDYICNRFNWSHQNSTRIVLPRTRTQFGSKSVFIQGASRWNTLPGAIKQCGTVEQFKEATLSYLTS